MENDDETPDLNLNDLDDLTQNTEKENDDGNAGTGTVAKKAKKIKLADTEQFISMYEVNDCLWNHRCKDYTNKFMRDDAEKALAAQFDVKVAEVRLKIRSLKNAYNAEKLKVKQSLKSGAGACDVYHSNWQFFNQLKFLNKVDDTSCRRIDNINNSPASTSNTSSPIPSPFQRKRKAKSQKDDNEDDLIKKCLIALATDEDDTYKDEFSIFGQNLAMKLRKLSTQPRLAWQAQRDTEKTIMEFEDKFYNLKFT